MRSVTSVPPAGLDAVLSKTDPAGSLSTNIPADALHLLALDRGGVHRLSLHSGSHT